MRLKTCFLLLLAAMLIMVSLNSFAEQAPLYKTNNVLVGANFNDGAGSSDMTLVMRLAGDKTIYVDEGDDVKYITDPDNEGVEGWTEIDFDDSDWSDGMSSVGFSDGDDNTTVPAGRISIWTRYYFDAPDAAKTKSLTLMSDYDDQFIAWLNGVQIAASINAPRGDPPAWNATAGGVNNHGSTEMPAGNPNEARWKNGSIQTDKIDFKFA